MSDQIKHFLARSTFGQYSTDEFRDLNHAIETILSQRSDFHFPLERASKIRQISKGKSREEKKAIQKENRQNLISFNLKWMNELARTKASLHEKMVIFWHNHFAVHTKIPKAAALHNNLLRKHALGKFGDLLHAVSKDPAMLLFLNNQQNKKSAPNENFARELMELFTIGKGNYTEKDIKESARAFTGWKTNLTGDFIKVKPQQDKGQKTFMGETGNFDGEDIIDLLIQNKKTSIFLVRKFYRYLVNDEIDEEMVSKWADEYYKTELHTGKLLKTIFTSDHFYEKKNRGTKIKSPVEYILFLMNDFGVKFNDAKALLGLQKILGQVLFQPPNVAGWPSGKAWIDSSSLLYRLNIGPAVILGNEIKVKDKRDFDANQRTLLGKKIGGKDNITRDLSKWANQSAKDYSKILRQVIHTELSPNATKLLHSPLRSDVNEYIRLCSKISSLPEYQLI